MTEVLDRAVSGPTVWKGEQLRGRTDWIHELTPHDVAEIDRALAMVRAADRPLFQIGPADFPLPALC